MIKNRIHLLKWPLRKNRNPQVKENRAVLTHLVMEKERIPLTQCKVSSMRTNTTEPNSFRASWTQMTTITSIRCTASTTWLQLKDCPLFDASLKITRTKSIPRRNGCHENLPIEVLINFSFFLWCSRLKDGYFWFGWDLGSLQPGGPICWCISSAKTSNRLSNWGNIPYQYM